MIHSVFATASQALALVTAVSAAANSVSPRQQSNPFTATPIATFAEPWSLAFLPDERILVTEKAGTLRLVDAAANGTIGSISGVPTVSYGGQAGLGDVVLHPNFAENNLVYISYSEPGDDDTSGAVVARAKLALDGDDGSLEDLEVIWSQVPKVSGNGHLSHRILFGDNSTLWISSGDRQLFDPAQDMESSLGKIIRLYDNGSIPEDNPFADQGDGVTAEVWALGVRNPLGIDFDAEGRLWEVEMGPRGGDELNLIERAGNYGWPEVSWGDHYSGESIPDHDTRSEFVEPKVWWTPVISPASMVVYKGDLFPDWTGNVIISGLGSQGLVRVEIDGNSANEASRYGMGSRMRCVREGPDGSLWTLEDGDDARLLHLTPSRSDTGDDSGSDSDTTPDDSGSGSDSLMPTTMFSLVLLVSILYSLSL